jgi:6-phosphogluconolactonase
MTKPQIKVFDDIEELAENIALELEDEINEAAARHKAFNLAISGGSTPKQLFKLLASDDFKHSSQWHNLHVYWVDERCVPAGDPESNYGSAYQIWLKNVPIPSVNIHRVRGEEDPEIEAKRYKDEIVGNLAVDSEGLPVFDLIILGIGNDGHTASLFPGDLKNLSSDDITVVAEHPETGQKRISLGLRTINNGLKVIFMATGKDKAGIIADILTDSQKKESYPAGLINPVKGDLAWYLDKAAAGKVADNK